MYKIGIISDTHNVLRDEVLEELKTCDLILHAGDFVDLKIYEKIKSIGKMIGVKGNNDHFELEKKVSFEIMGYSFVMTHQKQDIEHVDFYIYGHSHQYKDEMINDVHYLNPGSCGRKRFSLPLTYMLLYLDKKEYFVVRKDVI